MARLRERRDQLTELTARLTAIRSTKPDGSVVYNGFEFGDLATVVETMVAFEEALPEIERRRIISQALFGMSGHKPLTERTLLSAISRLERAYLARPLQSFYVYTTLSLGGPFVARVVRDGPVRLSLLRTRPTRITKALDASGPGVPPNTRTTDGLQWVELRVAARTVDEAIDLGAETLDMHRGLWNLKLQKGVRPLFSSEPYGAINIIRGGPFFTAHDRYGRIVHDSYWTDPAFEVPQRLDTLGTRWDTVLGSAARVQKVLAGIPYERELRRVFARYARALDGRDHEVTLIRLWGVLESLTATGDQKYDVTIRRAGFVLDDPEYTRLMLNHIRVQRNSHVHGGAASHQCGTFAYQLKSYVDTLFSIHVGMGKHFSTMGEFGRFLDLPMKKDALKERMRLIRLGLRFHA